MKELKQNMRKSALWRFGGFLIFAIAMCITFISATHQLYASKGDGNLEKIKKRMQSNKKSWNAKKNKLEKIKLQLKKELKDCKENNDLDKKLADCQDDMDAVDDSINALKLDLTLCQANLRATQSRN